MMIRSSTASPLAAGAAPIPNFIPTEIASLEQFVLWKLVPRVPKPSKVPYNPYRGLRASVVNPDHWSDLNTALAVLRAGRYRGIGFVLTAHDEFAGLDLDGCRNPQTGVLESWAADLVGQFDSYTEVSPSQTGVKIWFRGAVPGRGQRAGRIEVYSERRFFTLTGQRLDGVTTQINPRQSALDRLLSRLGAPNEPVLSSAAAATGFVPVARFESTGCVGHVDLAAILKRARNAPNGARFCRLYDHGDLSDFGGDRSAADFQLALYLKYWTKGDLAAMDALFRGSALFRDKWDAKRGDTTYGGLTLRAALRARRY